MIKEAEAGDEGQDTNADQPENDEEEGDDDDDAGEVGHNVYSKRLLI